MTLLEMIDKKINKDNNEYMDILWHKLATLLYVNNKKTKDMFMNYNMYPENDANHTIVVFKMTDAERKEKLQAEKILKDNGY
jgi:hypothetical protein